jgi:hypothetical protein
MMGEQEKAKIHSFVEGFFKQRQSFCEEIIKFLENTQENCIFVKQHVYSNIQN